MLKVGVIGFDRVQLYSKVGEAQLVGIVGEQEERSEEALHVNVYSSLDELMENEEIDVLDTTYLQEDIILKAVSFGKHVICQNPIAKSESGAKGIIAAFEEAGVQLWIRNGLKFSPEYKKVQTLIEKGAIGKVGTVRIIKNINQQEKANGVNSNILLKNLSWLQSLFGNVKRVYAKGLKNNGISYVDVAYVSLRFENGVIAHININSIDLAASERLFLEVAGEKGVISYDSSDVVPVQTTFYESNDQHPVTHKSYVNDPALEELKFIVQSIHSGSNQQSAEDYLHVFQSGLSVIESIKENKVITLSDGRVSI